MIRSKMGARGGAWFAAGLLALSFAACEKQKAEPKAEAPRQVAYTWEPPKPATVAGVPAAAIQSALQTRLKKGRPKGMDPALWTHVKKLYDEYDGAALWMESNGPNPKRTSALLGAIADAHTDALRLDGYPLDSLTRALETVRTAKPPTAEQLVEADLLLSSAYLALAEDLMKGQSDPKSMTRDWHIDYKHESVDSAVTLSLKADQLDAGIANMRPQDPEYQGLREALVKMRELVDRGGWPTVPEGKMLKRGDKAPPERLAALRARLVAEGFLPADSAVAPPAAPAGASTVASAPGTTGATTAAQAPAAAAPAAVYDKTLSDAVALFQERHGIPKDGVLGAETVKSMNVPAEYRLRQVAASLERYRWLPRSLGDRYIFVNVPAFRLQAFDSTGKALEMKVIVGKDYQGRTTPVFSDVMETVVFRPYWNVTPDIQYKEIVPAIRKDPGYLAANRMEYYRDGGETRIRQLPGPKNSLGLVKFLFPNSFNIYLHDTPTRLLFLKDVRAFSHGCIRLERPGELAQWVLGWDAARVEAAMEDGPDNRTITLPKKLPVYITYFTAYTRDGQLFFGNDLYSRDEQIVQAVADGARPSAETLQRLERLKALVTDSAAAKVAVR